MQLDYTIDSIEERKKIVEQILIDEPDQKPQTLERLANYLIMCMEKQEKKEKKILTDNRQVTIDKRETSFEGLVDKLENGENALYHIAKDDKNQLFQPKKLITKQDYADFPELRQIKDAIDAFKKKSAKASGYQAYLTKKATIELYKDLYLAKKQLKPPVMPSNCIQTKFPMRLAGLSLSDPYVVEALLVNYSKLKQDSWDQMNSDLWAIMMAFDDLCGKALKNNKQYELIVLLKIDGRTNAEIQKELQLQLGLNHTTEYISTLWRNRIPKYIADFAMREHLIWWYSSVKEGKWKRCSCCKQNKLASPIFFSKNKSSKDGYYSICKECRNKKVTK